MAKKSKKKTPSPKVSLSQSDKLAIQAELGVKAEDLSVGTPSWSYAAGATIVLLSCVAAVFIVRGGE
jgi:hypothetical protein